MKNVYLIIDTISTKFWEILFYWKICKQGYTRKFIFRSYGKSVDKCIHMW